VTGRASSRNLSAPVRLLHALAALPALLALELVASVGDARPAGAADSSSVRVEASPIKVGDTLQAVRDVSLDEAIVAEGSKVQVSGRRVTKAGVLVDVSLADGHVVKGLALPDVEKNFRRVEN
jgi:hypothetical protein